MAPQQGLYRGKERWKEQITINENKENLMVGEQKETHTLTPAEQMSKWAHRDGTNRRRPKSPSTWNNTDHTNNKVVTQLLLLFLRPAACVSQKEWHIYTSDIQQLTGRANSQAAVFLEWNLIRSMKRNCSWKNRKIKKWCQKVKQERIRPASSHLTTWLLNNKMTILTVITMLQVHVCQCIYT